MSDITPTPENNNSAKLIKKPAILAAVSSALFGTSLAAASYLGARSGAMAVLRDAAKAVPEVVEVAKGLIK